jgi:mannobiose 2-epimerase
MGTTSRPSWLLHWAAEMLEDSELVTRVRLMVKAVAGGHPARRHRHGGRRHLPRRPCVRGSRSTPTSIGWPQIEAAVGFLDAWQLLGDQRFYDAAWSAGTSPRRTCETPGSGNGTRADRHGTPFPGESGAGFWKCPYHTVRGCQEIVRRLNERWGDGKIKDQELGDQG